MVNKSHSDEIWQRILTENTKHVMIKCRNNRTGKNGLYQKRHWPKGKEAGTAHGVAIYFSSLSLSFGIKLKADKKKIEFNRNSCFSLKHEKWKEKKSETSCKKEYLWKKSRIFFFCSSSHFLLLFILHICWRISYHIFHSVQSNFNSISRKHSRYFLMEKTSILLWLE